MLLTAALSVYLLANDANGAPEVNVVANGYMSYKECQSWQADMRANQPTSVDPITGKRLISVYYQCNPVEPEKELTKLQKAIDENK